MAFECLKRPSSKIFWKDAPILNSYYKLQAFYLSRYVNAVPFFSEGIPLKGGTFPVKNG